MAAQAASFPGYPFVKAVVEANQLFGTQGSQDAGMPLIVIELNLGNGGSEQFDDGANLTANKSLPGHIREHGNFGKRLHFTHTSLTLQSIGSNSGLLLQLYLAQSMENGQRPGA